MYLLLVRRCPVTHRKTHTLSELIQSQKHFKYFMLFLNIHAETCLSFYFWSTVLMKWELFPRHWNPGKGGGEHLVEQTNLVPPTPMRTAGFVRQEEWLELLLFLVLILSFSLLWQLFGIWNSLRLTGSSASTRTEWGVFVSLLSPAPPPPQSPPFAGGHWCTFVSCNCVNVPVSIFSQTPKTTLKVLCVGFSHYCIIFKSDVIIFMTSEKELAKSCTGLKLFRLDRLLHQLSDGYGREKWYSLLAEQFYLSSAGLYLTSGVCCI